MHLDQMNSYNNKNGESSQKVVDNLKKQIYQDIYENGLSNSPIKKKESTSSKKSNQSNLLIQPRKTSAQKIKKSVLDDSPSKRTISRGKGPTAVRQLS